MKSLQKYVLVLSQQSDDLGRLKSLLGQLRCSVAIAHSEAQAVAQAKQAPPYLVIVANSDRAWSTALVSQLRSRVPTGNVMIIALTDHYIPRWSHYAENMGFDGVFVKPMSGEVLSSLVQSAWVRQTCLSA
jgi:CheY-like chemotaxis protein